VQYDFSALLRDAMSALLASERPFFPKQLRWAMLFVLPVLPSKWGCL
jgi:hypothetical protein